MGRAARAEKPAVVEELSRKICAWDLVGFAVFAPDNLRTPIAHFLHREDAELFSKTKFGSSTTIWPEKPR